MLIDKFASTKHLKRSIVSCRTKPYSPLQLFQAAGIATQARRGGNATGYPFGIKKNIFISLSTVYDITRFFDIIISFSCLIILLPLFLLIAFIIKISSKGPVIFSQKRVGKNNSDFTLYKFRTMRVDVNDLGSLMTL